MIQKIILLTALFISLAGSAYSLDCYDQYSGSQSVPVITQGVEFTVAGKLYIATYNQTNSGYAYFYQLTPTETTFHSGEIFYYLDGELAEGANGSITKWAPPADGICNSAGKGVKYSILITRKVVPCAQENALKQFDCGGIEHWDASSVNETTCESKCKCEESGAQVTYMDIKNFCEGSKNTSFIHDEEECTGECVGDCTYEYAALQRECGLQGIENWNETTCTGTCADNCTDEYAALEDTCGLSGVNQTTFDFENCTGECRADCTTEYNELNTECGILGIASFNDDTCTGTCRDCNYETKKCSAKCSGYVKDFECSDHKNNDGVYDSIHLGDCVCLDDDERYMGAALITGIGAGNVTDNAGTYGGTVTENVDGSKTETLSNGAIINYNNATDARPNGSIIYTTPNGSIQEHYTDDEGNEIVVSYDADSDTSSITSTQVVDGVEITETTTTEGNAAFTGIPEEGELVTTTNPAELITPVENEEDDDEYEEKGDPTDIGRINYSVLTSSVSQFGNKQPFSSISELRSIADRFDVTPVIPSWQMQIIPEAWGGVPFTVSLESFSGVAEMVRFLLGLGLWATAIWQIIKMWTR